jgi:hypothetical protein
MRRDVVERRVEDGLQRLLLGLPDDVERAVDDVSATDFLPSYMTAFMNLVTIRSPNFGSGRISRFSAL